MLELMLPETAIWLIACILMKSYHDRRFLSQAQKFVILLSTIAAILFSIYNYHKFGNNIFGLTHNGFYDIRLMVMAMLPALLCYYLASIGKMPHRRIRPGAGWAIASCILLGLIAIVMSSDHSEECALAFMPRSFQFLAQHFDPTALLACMWLGISFAIFAYKPFRIPGAIVCQIILLGILIYKADQGVGGSDGLDGTGVANIDDGGFTAAPSFDDTATMSDGFLPDTSMAGNTIPAGGTGFSGMDNAGFSGMDSPAFTPNDGIPYGNDNGGFGADSSSNLGMTGPDAGAFAAAAGTMQSPAGTAIPDQPYMPAGPSVMQDSSGFAQGTFTPDQNGNYSIQDNMGMQVGDASFNPVTGAANVSIWGSNYTISDGSLLDDNGMTLGKFVQDVNGGTILQDSQGFTIARLTQDNVLLNNMNQAIGQLK